VSEGYGFLVENLVDLVAQLRTLPPGPHPGSPELRRYLAGVQQGREQAAQRIAALPADLVATDPGQRVAPLGEPAGVVWPESEGI